MSHNHMSMGHMSGLPALTDFPKFYYAVVGSAVAVAALVNLYNFFLCRQRLRAGRAGATNPARPNSWMALSIATTFALFREMSHASIRIPFKNRILRLPTFGRTILILLNVTVLVVLCLYGLDLRNQLSREDVGFRCGVVSIAQLPLIFLLAGKNNIIGFFSGISYERINWLHRWCARCMLLTATLHMGYFFGAWAPYDYIGYQLKNNKIVWKGVAAWTVLVWINISSVAPIRGLSYEIFVLQHIISFALLLAFIFIHTPVEMNAYVWLPVGIFFFDRLLRVSNVLTKNLYIFHSRGNSARGAPNDAFTCKASFTPLPHDTTRIVIRDPPITWSPGQHVFLSCHSIVPLQSHPFTIASIPDDGVLEFLVKAETGGTRRFFKHAKKNHREAEETTKLKTVAIEGPYGSIRALRQFDSVVLLAGSTGATFTFPLLQDLVRGWYDNARPDHKTERRSFFEKPFGAVTRHVRFVWVVKSKRQLSWFTEKLWLLSKNFEDLQERLALKDIKLEMSVYITCEKTFTEEQKPLLSANSAATASSTAQKEPEHELTELRPRPNVPVQKQEIGGKEDALIESIPITSSESDNNARACDGANAACTCRNRIDESANPSDPNRACCCSTRPLSNNSSDRPASLQTKDTNTRPIVPASVTVLSGRPKTREIIRRSLELAMGESAVVVCGPQGLVADVKQDVCALSDERAVHKGTGAQGIYLHTESFGY